MSFPAIEASTPAEWNSCRVATNNGGAQDRSAAPGRIGQGRRGQGQRRNIVVTYGEPAFYGQVKRDNVQLNLRMVCEPVFVGDIREREELLATPMGTCCCSPDPPPKIVR